ncbi:hypothetical protein BGZ49_003834 [Haplosporangium sp. Z 27]|nr:hypothetical protein BGZ49_003834 [Haplosporangium sp. Z 27]
MQGSYGNESALTSQPIQYSYQQQQNDVHNQGYNNGVENGSYDGGYDGELQQQQQQQQQHLDASGANGQDAYYGQNSNNNNHSQGGYDGNQGGYDGNQGGYDGNQGGYDGNQGSYDNGVNALTSATLNMSGLGGNNGNNYHNNADNNNGNGGIANSNNNNNSLNSSNNNSGELTLSSDVRKLQDEVMSWKRSQESSQTKINQLRNTLTAKSQENRDLHQSLAQVTQDRLMLQELVHKREKEMDDLRSKYLNDVRQIRATDDDHSTIEQRVRMLQAAILQLTKSSSGDRAVNLNTVEVHSLVKKRYKFGNTQPYILNMFLEKYIMDTLLEEVFNGPPFYVGFELSKEYGSIHKWMSDNGFQDQAVRFRQQLCFLSAKSPAAQEFAVQEAARIAKGFEAKLETLYNNWTGHQKVLDLVTKAIELSLTMRSQNAEILAKPVLDGTDFDSETMVPAHKSKEGGKVKVCVMPCFIDTNGVVVGKAKANNKVRFSILEDLQVHTVVQEDLSAPGKISFLNAIKHGIIVVNQPVSAEDSRPGRSLGLGYKTGSASSGQRGHRMVSNRGGAASLGGLHTAGGLARAMQERGTGVSDAFLLAPTLATSSTNNQAGRAGKSSRGRGAGGSIANNNNTGRGAINNQATRHKALVLGSRPGKKQTGNGGVVQQQQQQQKRVKVAKAGRVASSNGTPAAAPAGGKGKKAVAAPVGKGGKAGKGKAGKGGNAKPAPANAESLDSELSEYMMKNEQTAASLLDNDLDTYMADKPDDVAW